MALHLHKIKTPTPYIIILLAIPTASEFAQLLGIIVGTFDLLDIILYISIQTFYLIRINQSVMKQIKKHLVGSMAIVAAIVAVLGSATSKNAISYTTGSIKLIPKKDDVFTKPSLVQYLKSTNNPTIVLRVPNQVDNVLEENRYSKNQIYNTIEKEFAKADFIVRDRALYQKVLEQNRATDYSKIKELTNTDLIIEFVGFENVKYYTNKYTDQKGREKTTDANLTLTGSKIEFKLIRVKDNDLVGSYTFHYTPCTSGCSYTFDKMGTLYSPTVKSKAITKPYEFVSSDALEEFFKLSAQRLIREMKK